MKSLEKDKRNEEWVRLEKNIIALIKEHYRLLGKPYDETITPELKAVVRGEG